MLFIGLDRYIRILALQSTFESIDSLVMDTFHDPSKRLQSVSKKPLIYDPKGSFMIGLVNVIFGHLIYSFALCISLIRSKSPTNFNHRTPSSDSTYLSDDPAIRPPPSVSINIRMG